MGKKTMSGSVYCCKELGGKKQQINVTLMNLTDITAVEKTIWLTRKWHHWSEPLDLKYSAATIWNCDLRITSPSRPFLSGAIRDISRFLSLWERSQQRNLITLGVEKELFPVSENFCSCDGNRSFIPAVLGRMLIAESSKNHRRRVPPVHKEPLGRK